MDFVVFRFLLDVLVAVHVADSPRPTIVSMYEEVNLVTGRSRNSVNAFPAPARALFPVPPLTPCSTPALLIPFVRHATKRRNLILIIIDIIIIFISCFLHTFPGRTFCILVPCVYCSLYYPLTVPCGAPYSFIPCATMLVKQVCLVPRSRLWLLGVVERGRGRAGFNIYVTTELAR